MSFNTVTVTGNVVADPVLRTANNGRVVTKVRVASNEQRRNPTTQEWETVNTSFYDVSCWQMLGERVAASIRKGDPVFFTGRQQVREFKREGGSTDHSVDVSADIFGPDLRRVSVTVNRRVRSAPVEDVTDGATAGTAETGSATPVANGRGGTTVDPWTTPLPREVPASEPAA